MVWAITRKLEAAALTPATERAAAIFLIPSIQGHLDAPFSDDSLTGFAKLCIWKWWVEGRKEGRKSTYP